MPVKATCSSCNKTVNGPDKFAGKKAKCPGCKEIIEFPGLEELAPPEEIVAAAPPEPAPEPESEESSSPKKMGPKKKGPGKKIGKSKGKGLGKSKLGGDGPKSAKTKRAPKKERPAAASTHSEEEDGYQEDLSPKKNNKLFLYIGIGVVSLAAIGAGVYFFLMGGEGTSSEGGKTSSPTKNYSLLAKLPEASGYGKIDLAKLLKIEAIREEMEKSYKEDANKNKMLEDLSDSPEAQELKQVIENGELINFISGKVKALAFALETEHMSNPEDKPKGVALLSVNGDAQEEFNFFKAVSKVEPKEHALSDGTQAFEFDKEQFASVLDESTIVFGSSLEDLEKAHQAKPTERNIEIENFANPLIGFLWESQGETIAPASPGMPVDPKEIERVEFASDYTDQDGFSISAILSFKSEESAGTAYGEMTKPMGPMMLVGMFLGQDGYKFSHDAKQLKLDIKLTPEAIENMKKQAEQMSMGGPPPGMMAPPVPAE